MKGGTKVPPFSFLAAAWKEDRHDRTRSAQPSAVASSDVPAYGVVIENPGRALRLRFDEATITALLSIAWWNWPVEMVTQHLAATRGADIAALQAATQDQTL